MGFLYTGLCASRTLFYPDDFSKRLLEVPVGTAALSLEKYKVLSEAKIVAVDYSKDMLNIAARRFMDNHLTNVDCVEGNVGSLNFKNEVFDVVLSMNGFHAFPDKHKAFYETARVLKRGGIFCGCFYVKGQRKLTDFIVKRFYMPMGFFTPPFYDIAEVKIILRQYYRNIEINNQKSILYFKCIK